MVEIKKRICRSTISKINLSCQTSCSESLLASTPKYPKHLLGSHKKRMWEYGKRKKPQYSHIVFLLRLDVPKVLRGLLVLVCWFCTGLYPLYHPLGLVFSLSYLERPAWLHYEIKSRITFGNDVEQD